MVAMRLTHVVLGQIHPGNELLVAVRAKNVVEPGTNDLAQIDVIVARRAVQGRG
jgi:hypothetical protein